ncbi:MAG: class I SAM-dependent methyltransferase, partial [Vicinamibacterales bacterium]
MDLFGPPARRTFAVRLWDGTVDTPSTGTPPRFTLALRRPGALRRMLVPPSELALGEAYLRDDFDIEGDVEAAVGLGTVVTRIRSPLALVGLLPRLLALPTDDLPAIPRPDILAELGRRSPEHSKPRDAAAVRYHYDVGNDFYGLWLDRRMVYSCAYFETGDEDLDTAQAAKLELICRKLRLKPGERLLDIGCGWGGLVQYAAERYGVEATGITLSEPQANLARRLIAADGLADRCRIDVRDYRDLPASASFDKVVSVGMVEHVGRARLPTYFAEAYRLIRPGGLFLNHGIVIPRALRFPPLARRVEQLRGGWGAFIQRYVFPDVELLAPCEMIGFGEQAGFETRDVENLREHYAVTLRHWVRRLEARHAETASLVGQRNYRIWRLYMAASAHGFATAKIGVVQLLFSKPDLLGTCHLPLTRADLYREVTEASTELRISEPIARRHLDGEP